MRTPRIYIPESHTHTPSGEIRRFAAFSLSRSPTCAAVKLPWFRAWRRPRCSTTSSEDAAALLARLRDLGFIAGARCEIVARMWLGGDPLVVRIGGSTFALRRAEAAAVRVLRQQEAFESCRARPPGRKRSHRLASMDALVSTSPLRIALVGVPNCGKTALFNRLTGSHQKVANYPGVTVERREGERAAADGRVLRVLDLPGTYSLKPTTLDEAITRDVLLGRVADAPAPGLVVCVVDAVHLPIGLRLALEVKRLGLPMVLALNRMDVARRRGVQIDVARLSSELGVPVLPTVAVKRGGADALIEAIEPARWRAIAGRRSRGLECARQRRRRADPGGIAAACSAPSATRLLRESRWAARLDAVLLHPLAGILVLAVVMFLIFQAVFSWADAAHGRHRCGHGRARCLGQDEPGRRAAVEPAGRWRDRGRGRRAGVPAADRHPVLLHPGARGFRLPAARRLSTRPAHGLGGTLGPRVHSAAVEPRLRHPGHHGDAHHPELARPPDHHHDRAADGLLGAPAGVPAADRRVHSAHRGRALQPAGAGAVRLVRGGHRVLVPGGLRR